MAAVELEFVLIFLITFSASLYIIYSFRSYVDSATNSLIEFRDSIYPKNFYVCYNEIKYFNDSSVYCMISGLDVASVSGKNNTVEISGANEVFISSYRINIRGAGVSDFYLYNENGTIYIV